MRRLEDWIDYMEGEWDNSKMDQLNMLLKHSKSDQIVLDNLRRVRKWVKWTDPSDAIDFIIEDKKFEKNFWRKVMGSISETSNADPVIVTDQKPKDDWVQNE